MSSPLQVCQRIRFQPTYSSSNVAECPNVEATGKPLTPLHCQTSETEHKSCQASTALCSNTKPEAAGQGCALVIALGAVAVAVGGRAVAPRVLQHAQQRRQQLPPQRAARRRLQLRAPAQHLPKSPETLSPTLSCMHAEGKAGIVAAIFEHQHSDLLCQPR